MLDVSKVRNVSEERPWYLPALDLIKNINSGKVLDLGCGLGEFSIKLRDLGFNPFCVDGSPRYVKKVKELGFEAKVCDLNNKLPFQDNSFDLVICLEVIEHIEKAENLIEEIKRVLNKGGHLLISTPNYAFFWVRLRILFGLTLPDEGYHFRFFTHNSFRKLLKKRGFNIIGDNSISFLPFYRLTKKIPKGRKVRIWKNLLASKIIVLAKNQN